VALGLALHFLVFVVPAFWRDKLPGKEFDVGLFFALGAYTCLGWADGILPLLMSVALVVAFNCLVIAARDAESDRVNDPGGASRWWRTMKRDLVWTGAVMAVIFGVAAGLTPHASFYVAVAASFLLLTALQIYSPKLGGDAVRALADFALLTPVLAEGAFSLLEAGR
jgi:hypothetical protein